MLVCLSVLNTTCAMEIFQSVCFLKSPGTKSTGERLGEFCGGEQVAETYTSRSGGCFSTLLPSDHFTSDHFPKGNTRKNRNTEMQFENTRNTNTGSRELHVSQWWLLFATTSANDIQNRDFQARPVFISLLWICPVVVKFCSRSTSWSGKAKTCTSLSSGRYPKRS